MSGIVKIGFFLLLGVIAISLVLRIVSAALAFLWTLVIPLAIVGVIGLVVYNLINNKSLGGGGRSLP